MGKLMNWLYFFTKFAMVSGSKKSKASSFKCKLKDNMVEFKLQPGNIQGSWGMWSGWFMHNKDTGSSSVLSNHYITSMLLLASSGYCFSRQSIWVIQICYMIHIQPAFNIFTFLNHGCLFFFFFFFFEKKIHICSANISELSMQVC